MFQRDCQVCHGADRAARRTVRRSSASRTRLSAEEMRATVTNGKGRMPPLPHLIQTDVDAVVAYLAAADAGRGAAAAGAAEVQPRRRFHRDPSSNPDPRWCRPAVADAVAGRPGRRRTRKASRRPRSGTR